MISQTFHSGAYLPEILVVSGFVAIIVIFNQTTINILHVATLLLSI